MRRAQALILLLILSACSSVPNTGKLSSPAISYALNGDGPAAVVLQSGLGDGKATWNKVFAPLAQHSQVMAYDRPGYGASESSTLPRDPCSIAREQRQILHSLGIAPPYLLVGHSIGGLYQYVFAKLYPDEVAGLVLLDATHPEHWQRMQQQAPTQAALIKGLRLSVFSQTERNEFDQQAACLAQFIDTAPLAKPAIMLESGQRRLEELGAYDDMLGKNRQDWQGLISQPEVVPVAGSGHYLQQDSPEQVLAAISRLQARIRAK